jgi:hypothetical protein
MGNNPGGFALYDQVPHNLLWILLFEADVDIYRPQTPLLEA